MTDSLTQNRIGCGSNPPVDNAVDKPNQLTLVDAGKLYEEVANGFLDLDSTNIFYEIIDDDDGRLDTIIDQEVIGLGLSSDGLTDFKSERDSALKAGSYGLSTGLYRSTAGWVDLPFKDSSCNVIPQEYVYGVFINAADALGPQDDIRTQGIELFREEIRAALETWADCETDLSIEKTGPSNPVVAGTQIVYSVTVENIGPNDATNVVVVDTLSAGLIFVSTSGCTEDPNGVPTCNLGTITDGSSKSFDITVDIPADFVYNGGTKVENKAEVSADQFDFNLDNNDDTIKNDVIAVADVEILTFIPSDVITSETSFDVTLTKTITNNGISAPVDVNAEVEVSGDGVTVVPDQVFPGVDELEKDEIDEIEESFTITCDESGIHEVVFTNEIMPVNAEDPDLSNNEAQVSVEIICPVVLVIDEDSIDNGNEPNFFEGDGPDGVNEDDAEVGVRDQLPFFAANVGETITLHTGEVGDEGWFALKTIPDSWNGLSNFVSAGEPEFGDSEDLLDKIPDVTPLRATGLKLLEDQAVCAVVYDSDISINYDPLNGSLKGANLGTVAFKVISVTELIGHSDKSLPKVEIEILDADVICGGQLELLTDAPEPESSSEPEDVVP